MPYLPAYGAYEISEAGKSSYLHMEYTGNTRKMEDIINVLHLIFFYCDLNLNIKLCLLRNLASPLR